MSVWYLGTQLVHHVAKLMEVGLDLIVLEERGGVGRGLAEVGHHSGHGHLT